MPCRHILKVGMAAVFGTLYFYCAVNRSENFRAGEEMIWIVIIAAGIMIAGITVNKIRQDNILEEL